jgi:hypothetical protein
MSVRIQCPGIMRHRNTKSPGILCPGYLVLESFHSMLVMIRGSGGYIYINFRDNYYLRGFL